jgi:hypothetical protein
MEQFKLFPTTTNFRNKISRSTGRRYSRVQTNLESKNKNNYDSLSSCHIACIAKVEVLKRKVLL